MGQIFSYYLFICLVGSDTEWGFDHAIFIHVFDFVPSHLHTTWFESELSFRGLSGHEWQAGPQAIAVITLSEN